jgi:hypothetical protein
MSLVCKAIQGAIIKSVLFSSDNTQQLQYCTERTYNWPPIAGGWLVDGIQSSPLDNIINTRFVENHREVSLPAVYQHGVHVHVDTGINYLYKGMIDYGSEHSLEICLESY